MVQLASRKYNKRASATSTPLSKGHVARTDKRWFDLAFVAITAVVFLPIWLPAWLIVIAAIYCAMGSPIFYVQDRVGKDGKVFRMIKFRTMERDAELVTGPVLASAEDPRITPLGRLLRRSSLDEAPQVINIIRGEMSLVGPRPERPELCHQHELTLPDFPKRLEALPGIIHLTYVRHPNHSYRMSMRHRLRYDLFYIRRAGPMLDAWMICVAAKHSARQLLGIGTKRS